MGYARSASLVDKYVYRFWKSRQLAGLVCHWSGATLRTTWAALTDNVQHPPVAGRLGIECD
jgi:hypothetical protein